MDGKKENVSFAPFLFFSYVKKCKCKMYFIYIAP